MGNALGGYIAGVGGGILIDAVNQGEVLFCFLQIRFFPGKLIVFGTGNGIEGFAKPISALSQGLSVSSNGEVHSSVAVKAVGLEEVQTAFGKGGPLLLITEGVAKMRIGPGGAALHPDTFIGGVDLAEAVQTIEHTAVFPVPAVLQPEGNTAFKQFFFEKLPIACQFFCHIGVHITAPPIFVKLRYLPKSARCASWLCFSCSR